MTDAAREQLDEAQYMYLQMLRDAGCKFLFVTEKFGKKYVWMKSPSGSVFLERIPENNA